MEKGMRKRERGEKEDTAMKRGRQTMKGEKQEKKGRKMKTGKERDENRKRRRGENGKIKG